MNNNSDNDPSWKLLDKASTQQADEMFSRNVMRSIRLEEQESTSWWKKLLQPTPALATLATAAACVALIVTTQTDTTQSPQHSISSVTTPEESFEQLTADYQVQDDFDDLISPIALIATNDSDMLNNLDIFMNF